MEASGEITAGGGGQAAKYQARALLCHATPICKPKQVIPYLAKGKSHRRKGYSACELAHSWLKAKQIPPAVRDVLDTCPDYREPELIEGFFEREVDLRTPGKASQVDLLALVHTRDGYAVIAVEGKADEPFGPVIGKWLSDGSTGKQHRLKKLCEVLSLDPQQVSDLRYQLLHRAVAAVFEAQRYRCQRALMLVHSFSAKQASFDDFGRFVAAMGQPIISPGRVSELRLAGKVELRLAWVADHPAP